MNNIDYTKAKYTGAVSTYRRVVMDLYGPSLMGTLPSNARKNYAFCIETDYPDVFMQCSSKDFGQLKLIERCEYGQVTGVTREELLTLDGKPITIEITPVGSKTSPKRLITVTYGWGSDYDYGGYCAKLKGDPKNMVKVYFDAFSGALSFGKRALQYTIERRFSLVLDHAYLDDDKGYYFNRKVIRDRRETEMKLCDKKLKELAVETLRQFGLNLVRLVAANIDVFSGYVAYNASTKFKVEMKSPNHVIQIMGGFGEKNGNYTVDNCEKILQLCGTKLSGVCDVTCDNI